MKTHFSSLLVMQYLGRAWVAQAKTLLSRLLTWSHAAPKHTMYHCHVAPLGSAATRRDCSWEKLLTGTPSTAAKINLLGGLLVEKQILYSAQNPGTTMKGERPDEHWKNV